MRKFTAIMAASAIAFSASAMASQDNGLVVVDLSNANVLNNLAQNLHVNVSDIQALNNVSIPIGLAAAVCGVNANVLASEKKTGGSHCTATNSTAALQKAVQQKLHSGTHQ
jgi:hypothetical protein